MPAVTRRGLSLLKGGCFNQLAVSRLTKDTMFDGRKGLDGLTNTALHRSDIDYKHGAQTFGVLSVRNSVENDVYLREQKMV